MIELRDYQSEDVTAILAALRDHRSALYFAATGAGKTITFVELARRVVISPNRSGRILIVAHRGELIEQVARACANAGLSFEIEKAGKRVDPKNPPPVVIASVQTLQRERLAQWPRDAFKLVIVDECHHAPASSYRAILNHFAPAKVLGVSATPDRADGEPLGDVFEVEAARREMAELQARGYLVPFTVCRIEVKGLDLSNVKTRNGDLSPEQLRAELVRDAPVHGIARPLSELFENRKTIAFCAGVDAACHLASTLGEYGVKAQAVFGEQSPELRRSIIESYVNGDTMILCNARLLEEGTDLPITACIADCVPTKNRALKVQRYGRGSRLYAGKSDCLILDFTAENAGSHVLVGPEDALAGCEWKRRPDVGFEKKRAAEAAAREREAALLREINTVGVHYSIIKFPLEAVLAAKLGHTAGHGKPASPKQTAALKQLGFNFNHTPTQDEARICFDILNGRKLRGLASIKVAKKLASYGLPDNLTAEEAAPLMAELRANCWRPPARWYREGLVPK